MSQSVRRSVLVALFVASAPASAWAHGGQYQGPGGAVPPGLQEPSDPTPPPPPPTTPPPESAPPSPGGPVTPRPPPTPTKPPPQTPLTDPAGPESGAPRRGPTIGYDNWTFWWAYEGPALLRVKDELYRLRFSGPSPLSVVGGGTGRSDAYRATEATVRREVVPALLAAMDPARREHPDARSAAYLALARVTDDPAHVDRLAAAVFPRDGVAEDPIVRESAALALGLLRRGDPARQLDARTLDRARDHALRAVEDDRLATRTRAFAAVALGLLGDQPSTRGRAARTGDGGGASAEPPAAARILELLGREEPQADVPACLFLALGLQPAEDVPSAARDALQDAATKGRWAGRPLDAITASYATLALGRLGSEGHARALGTVLRTRTASVHVQRSAAVALGVLGERLGGAGRADAVATLVRAAEQAREGSVRAFATMAVARLLARDASEGRSDAWDAPGARPDRWLLETAEKGGFVLRPYGALALGLVAAGVGDRPSLEAHGAFRVEAQRVLREGLNDRSADPRSRGAFAVGLGLARDDGARKALVALVADDGLDRELRGYAALALGMLRLPTRDVVGAVSAALRERSSEELRLHAATALGLLGQPGAVDVLVRELDEADTQAVQGQVVVALGRIGDARALPPLLRLARDAGKPDLTRAMAYVALGLVGDLEPVPSLTRVSASFNYRSCVEAVKELLSIL